MGMIDAGTSAIAGTGRSVFECTQFLAVEPAQPTANFPKDFFQLCEALQF
jgi:hypothetical protein